MLHDFSANLLYHFVSCRRLQHPSQMRRQMAMVFSTSFVIYCWLFARNLFTIGYQGLTFEDCREISWIPRRISLCWKFRNSFLNMMNIWFGDPEVYFNGLRNSEDASSKILGVRRMEHSDLSILERLIHPDTYTMFGDVNLGRILCRFYSIQLTERFRNGVHS
ncbi:hypothetical protein WN55_07855 [Dufourea novaeangliae]|uniref:Uncharacterized protein n=1 Tax=Dufourea novaeangliae TaxID=178035 RepID=A0A154PT92_DUFNO|nr:hypothetical protein WN55_07855 [Dufourea novaeangliae]